jgi:hypothetical protein
VEFGKQLQAISEFDSSFSYIQDAISFLLSSELLTHRQGGKLQAGDLNVFK